MTEHYTIPKDSALESVLALSHLEKDLIIIAYELGRSAKRRLE